MSPIFCSLVFQGGIFFMGNQNRQTYTLNQWKRHRNSQTSLRDLCNLLTTKGTSITSRKAGTAMLRTQIAERTSFELPITGCVEKFEQKERCSVSDQYTKQHTWAVSGETN